jgi:uncharacterized membrane protein (DUF2068 family)
MAYQSRTVTEQRASPGIWILVGVFVFTGCLMVVAGLGVGVADTGINFLPANSLLIHNAVAVTSLGALGLALVIIGVLDFITAWGIWRTRGWGWGLAMILSIISLAAFPVGTIVAVPTIVYLGMVRRDYRRFESTYTTTTGTPGTPGSPGSLG